MTNKKVELLTKVGPKGQIVIRKDIREILGIKPGIFVKQRVIDREIRIKPIDEEDIKKELIEVDRIAKMVSKHWPKGVSAVDAIREERR